MVEKDMGKINISLQHKTEYKNLSFGIILMDILLIIGFASILLGLLSLYSYNDYLDASVWISVGISLVLMNNVGINNFLMFTGHGLLSAKVILMWLTLIVFLLLVTYKVFRDTGRII